MRGLLLVPSHPFTNDQRTADVSFTFTDNYAHIRTCNCFTAVKSHVF